MLHERPSISVISKAIRSLASSSPENQFRWAEYFLIAVAALNQLGWKRAGDATEVISVVIPLVLLVVLALINSLRVPPDNRRRMVLILGELAVVAIASFLAPHRIYRNLFLIIIGKGALLLNRTCLIIVIAVTLIQQIIFVTLVESKAFRWVALFPEVMNGRFILACEYVVYFTLTLFLVVLVSTLLKSEQESRRRAEQLKLDMDSMAMTLERERIARDIHDSLGHALTGLNVQLQLAQKLQQSDPARSHEAINLARGFAMRAVADVRRAVRAVRDSYFDFPAAVKELEETFESGGGCKITTTMDPLNVSPQLTHNLFFLIQEGLTNVQRHAHATSVILELTSDDQIHLRIKDDGIGFVNDDGSSGFGIKGMEERVASLGGVISINSAEGEGTEISITIPTTAAPSKDALDDQSSSS